VTLSKSLLVSAIVLQGIINGKRTKMTVVYKTDLEKDFEHVRCSLTMFPHQILINLTDKLLQQGEKNVCRVEI
jgi:hypothetical protein